VTDVCDCGARGRGLDGWIRRKRRRTQGRGDIPALSVRDSTAAAATWLDMARYSDTVGISQRYTPGRKGACSSSSSIVVATGSSSPSPVANEL